MRYLENHKKIMLILTENCNLRCKYCYEIDKHRSDMTFEKARDILKKCLDDMMGYSSAVIELHGGEPFLNFELVKQIDEFVINNYDYPILFRSTTNGTVFTKEVKEWLSERKDRYEIMLSLDGKMEDHNLNRITVNNIGSFHLIDIDFFRSTWVDCPVSMTVNEDTVCNLAENTIWIQNQEMDCLNAFQWATSWDLERTYPVLKRELKKLVKYYSENPDKHICLLMNYNFNSFEDDIRDDFRYCVYIDDPIECYDAEGIYAPCHGFTSFTMGSKEKALEFAQMSIKDFEIMPENICYECRLIRQCRICFAANHMLTGNMQIQNKEICIFNQICILAGIATELERDKKYPEKHLTEDYKKILNNVCQYIAQRKELDVNIDYFMN